MVAKIINGTEMADQIKAEIAEGVVEMQSKHGIVPGLAVVLVGDDPASKIYVRNKNRAANSAGMTTQPIQLLRSTEQSEVVNIIRTLNRDDRVHGILVQLPLPSQIDESTIIESIHPDKDVDGLHPFNMGLLMAGNPRFVPATPSGIQQMLLRSGVDPAGQHVVVCGRSNIVGKPLASLLLHRTSGGNATVTVCHSRTKNLTNITRQADILIAAIGQPSFITAEMVKLGVVVIDVGINRIDSPERKRGYRLVGDVDYDAVSLKAAAITPVPGGVGPMTIAMLLQNTLKAARYSSHLNTRKF